MSSPRNGTSEFQFQQPRTTKQLKDIANQRADAIKELKIETGLLGADLMTTRELLTEQIEASRMQTLYSDKRIAELTSENNELRKQTEKLAEHMINETSALNNQLYEQKQYAKADRSDLTQQLQAAAKHEETFLAQKKSMLNEIERLKTQLLEQKQDLIQKANLNKEFTRQTAELDKANQLKATYISQNKQLTEKISKLLNQNATLSKEANENAIQKQQFVDLKTKLTQASILNNNYEQQQKKYQADIKKLKTQITEKSEKLQAATDQLDGVEKQNNQLVSKVSDLQGHIHQHSAQVDIETALLKEQVKIEKNARLVQEERTRSLDQENKKLFEKIEKIEEQAITQRMQLMREIDALNEKNAHQTTTASREIAQLKAQLIEKTATAERLLTNHRQSAADLIHTLHKLETKAKQEKQNADAKQQELTAEAKQQKPDAQRLSTTAMLRLVRDNNKTMDDDLVVIGDLSSPLSVRSLSDTDSVSPLNTDAFSAESIQPEVKLTATEIKSTSPKATTNQEASTLNWFTKFLGFSASTAPTSSTVLAPAEQTSAPSLR